MIYLAVATHGIFAGRPLAMREMAIFNSGATSGDVLIRDAHNALVRDGLQNVDQYALKVYKVKLVAGPARIDNQESGLSGKWDDNAEHQQWLEDMSSAFPDAFPQEDSLDDEGDAPPEMLSYGEIIQLLNNEHGWCVAHPEDVDPEYRKGFMAGLEQAKRLITGLTLIVDTNIQPGGMGDYGGPGCDPVDV